MSQQQVISQAVPTTTEIPATLGNLPSVGPTTQQISKPVTIQASATATSILQPQQTTFQTQTTKNQQQQQSAQSSSNATDFPQFLTKTRLQELVKEVDPTEQLDEEVEEVLLQLADDFVETTVNAACLLAKHRHSNTVEVKDVQLHLERNWNMWIPGFGTDEVRPYKRAAVNDAHKQRLALIRKTIKKY